MPPFTLKWRDGLNAMKLEQLPHCVARGDIEAVKSMLAKGADVKAVEAEHGPLDAMAMANGKEKMAEYLRSEASH